MQVFKIVPTVQQYDWGKIGASSKVAVFAQSAGIPDFHIDESKPYAEVGVCGDKSHASSLTSRSRKLWMGTHPKSPSLLLSSGETLASYLAKNKHLIGEKVSQKFSTEDGNLPFLFKVLAIEKALSIQSHPDKATAEKLHIQQPDIYKGESTLPTALGRVPMLGFADPNHKPEMALALTPFTALCGFLPLANIATYLDRVPELLELIPREALDNFRRVASTTGPNTPAAKQALRDIFSAVMTAPTDTFTEHLARLIKRFESRSVHAEEESVRELVLRLNAQFPNDIGIFCSFLLNYVELSPGEAIFLGAGEPHAYISGGQPLPIPLQMNVNHRHMIYCRHHRVHGQLRQCHPCWTHAQITRHPQSGEYAHIYRCTCFAPCRQTPSFLAFLGIYPLRSPHYRVQRSDYGAFARTNRTSPCNWWTKHYHRRWRKR